MSYQINFDTVPCIGTIIRLDAQHYELVHAEPHTKRDGQPTVLLTWHSECPDCGAPFSITTGLQTKAVNRRCASCKKTGKPVNGKRGRAVSVEVCHAP